MIRVIYRDGKEDLVTPKFLDILLFMGEVYMFERTDGWAIVGVDPLRRESRRDFKMERRQHRPTPVPSVHQFC